MHLLVNAWRLCSAPETPLAFHIEEMARELLRQEEGLKITLAGPSRPPIEFSERMDFCDADLPTTDWGKLRFEQRALPHLAERVGADLIFSPVASAPLRSPVPVVAFSTELSGMHGDGFLARLRRAVAQAGLSGATARLRWKDEPGRTLPGSTELEPTVSPAFRPTDPGTDREVRSQLKLPLGYVLCLGAERIDLPVLLAAWTWVDGSVGDAYPLTFIGLSTESRGFVKRRAEELNVTESVMLLESVGLDHLPAIYRGADAFLHPGFTRSGQELRWALATGVPIASPETPFCEAVVGGAAYLVPKGKSRALGAACLTLLVERQEVAKSLREKGLVRAGDFHGEAPRGALMGAIQDVMSRTEEADE